MFAVKEAVARAAEFATGVLGQDRAVGLQLEEVELTKHNDREAWHITLSMLRPNPFGGGALSPTLRDYKVFAVDRETGEVLSMKIRELAGVE